MIPKDAIPDAGDILFLSSLHKPWYLHYNEHNSVAIPIPAYAYIVISLSVSPDYVTVNYEEGMSFFFMNF